MQTQQNTIHLNQIKIPTARDIFPVNPVARYKIAKFLVVTLIGLLIFLIGATISLIAYQRAYAERILPNVYLAGADVSGVTKSALTRKIDNLATSFNKQINRLFISPEIMIEAANEEIGLSVDKDQTLQSVYQIGKDGNIITLAQELLADSLNPKNIPLSIKINENRLNQFIDEKIVPQVKAPQDAQIGFINGQIEIKSEVNGLAINTESISGDLLDLASNNQATTLYIESKIVAPAIKKENLETLKNKLAALISQSLTLKAGEKSLHIKSEDLFKMIAFTKENDQVIAQVNTQALESYLRLNEKKLVIPKIDKQIVAGSNVVIREGKNGQKIDREQAALSLNQAIAAYLNGSIESSAIIEVSTTEEIFAEQIIDPKDLTSASALAAAAPIGKSIVIDISEQRLTAFENGQVVNSFLISSGMPGYESPRGEFKLGTRQYSKWYYGYNRDGSFWSYPNTLYNMNITGPYWLHGAYWHNNFGRKMSHGCINVHYTNAEWLWNWTEIGTPIVIQE